MIISVIGPVHGQAGNTTAALLISLLMSKSKTVCLTHLSAQTEIFYKNLGLKVNEDLTCTPSQVANLLRAGTITPEEMCDYCQKANENLDIFSNNSKIFTDSDMEIAAKYITENMPHDFVVIDVDINLGKPLAKYVVEKADLLAVTLTQSNNVFERYDEIFNTDNFKQYRNKSIYFCNHYSPELGSVHAFAKRAGVNPSKCCALRYSETVIKLSNEGKFAEILSASENLPDIKSDLVHIESIIFEQYKALQKKKIENARKMMKKRKQKGVKNGK